MKILVKLLFLFFLFSDCNISAYNHNSCNVIKDTNEARIFINYMELHNDFVKNKCIPKIVRSYDVHNNLDNSSQLIIDIRSPKKYKKGHIKGAVNIQFRDLYDYVNNKLEKTYDKIIIVCSAGQKSSYATSLLRLSGHKNIFAMKWGMNSWHKDFATDFMQKNASDKYISKIETKERLIGKKNQLPTLKTGKSNPNEIFKTRMKQMFKEGFKNAGINNKEVFNNLDKYYIISYWPLNQYEKGHIYGSIRYEPKKSLNMNDKLTFIPPDKEVVIHCYSGHRTAFTVAYLRLIGYDAKTLLFGYNNIMPSQLPHSFSEENIHNYPYVKGNKAKNSKKAK